MALGNPERDYVYGTKQAAKIALTQLNRKLTQSEALLGGYVIRRMGTWLRRIDWRDAQNVDARRTEPLPGKERVRRHRMRKAGQEPPLIERGLKSRLVAQLMQEQHCSRATAFRRLEGYVGGLPMVIPGEKPKAARKRRKPAYIKKPHNELMVVDPEQALAIAQKEEAAVQSVQHAMAAELKMARPTGRKSAIGIQETAYLTEEEIIAKRKAWHASRRRGLRLFSDAAERYYWDMLAKGGPAGWRPPEPATIMKAYDEGMAAYREGKPLPNWGSTAYNNPKAGQKIIAWTKGWQEERDRAARETKVTG